MDDDLVRKRAKRAEVLKGLEDRCEAQRVERDKRFADILKPFEEKWKVDPDARGTEAQLRDFDQIMTLYTEEPFELTEEEQTFLSRSQAIPRSSMICSSTKIFRRLKR
jgi:hypothetical protein